MLQENRQTLYGILPQRMKVKTRFVFGTLKEGFVQIVKLRFLLPPKKRCRIDADLFADLRPGMSEG